MKFLNKITVKQRLWANLVIVTVILVFIAMTSRNALQQVNQSSHQLKTIQETQSAKISEFQTLFSNTLLSMNQYVLTLDKAHGETFNTQIEKLKELNLALNSDSAESGNEGQAEAENNTADTEKKTEQTSDHVNPAIDETTAKMADILMNIKKSANSLVFLKNQVQETIVYGIEPSALEIQKNINKIKQIEHIYEQGQEQISELEKRLETAQNITAKMTSSHDLSYKTQFDEQGLGDLADELFETLSELFEGDFSNQETYENLVAARDGYQESFNDIADYFKTSKQNDITISELSSTATALVQGRQKAAEAMTTQLIEELNTLSANIIFEVTVETLIALVILTLINLLVVSSITTPISVIRQRVMDIAHNGHFSQWQSLPGKNELSDISDCIHDLLISVQSVTSEINQVSRSLAEGDLTAKFQGHYQGDLNELSQNFNSTMLQVRETLKAIDKSSVALANGQLDTTIELQKFNGDYAKVMSNLQSAIDIQGTSVNAIIEVMEKMSLGDFSRRIEVELPGDYALLKENLNDSLNKLEQAIQTSNEILHHYQQGDFTYQPPVQFAGRLNDLKSNMDALANNISQMLYKVKLAAHDSLSGVSEISSGNQDLNQRVQIQASSLQNTSQNMEMMTATLAASLSQAEEANNLSDSVKEQIQQGRQVVDEMDRAMHDISKASEEIADITAIIDGIAFQTNLLALNAAVEAARAGEAGRGFAVVAGEVRQLAGRSAEAAKQIREVSESSLKKVQNGLALSQQTTETFSNNQVAVEEVSEKVSEVHRNLNQQAQGIQEINHAFNEIDNGTQQNASLVEEIASASVNITNQMQELESSVASFKLLSGNKP